MRAFLQLTLGLFDEPAAPVSDPPRVVPPDAAAGKSPKPPSSLKPSAAAAPHADPALRILRHPQTDREILLQDQRVGYTLRRARRRTIGFTVGPEGLSVSAPRWVTIGEIEQAVREKGVWILRKMQEQADRNRRLEATRIVWAEGALVPFLGQSLRLRLDASRVPSAGGAVLEDEGLLLGLPTQAQPERIRDAVHGWWQRQARRVFEERCALYAPQLGVQFKRLSLSSAQTRWGSATVDGSIRLNWRLIQFPISTIDYVVVHELAHLREMNHSAAFWDVVRSVLPQYESAQDTLKQATPMAD